MPELIGHVEAVFRYPVKSMAGERLETAELGWHGLDGDRRLAFRRTNDRSGFPWLSAGKLPELVLYTPQCNPAAAPQDLPSSIRTPEGEVFSVFSPALAADVESRHGAPVEMMQLKHGIFDEAAFSIIAMDTLGELERLSRIPLDVRRFRPNVLIRPLRQEPFQEDSWVGGTLSFGDGEASPAVAVTMRDIRCSMLNIDPDSAHLAAEVLKTVVRVRQNNAGVYGAVIRPGRLAPGQAVFYTRG